jgi:hypothetical protein
MNSYKLQYPISVTSSARALAETVNANLQQQQHHQRPTLDCRRVLCERHGGDIKRTEIDYV